MSAALDYLKMAWTGFDKFTADYKYLVLVVCILVYAFVHWKEYKDRNVRRFLIYVVIVMGLLFIPITAIVFLIYQTRFYDYGWVWSAVPLTAVLAWGIVEVIYHEISLKSAASEEETGKKTESGRKTVWARWAGIAAAVVILFLCGNHGRILQLSEEEQQVQQAASEILLYMEVEDLLQHAVAWGDKDIMQYLRSHSGEVTLFYGRDMWDAKAGAYDYEGYETEEIACYEWMEVVSSAHNLYLLEVDQAPESVHEALATEEYLRTAIEHGVNTLILPEQIDPWMERKIRLVAEERNLVLTIATVGEYTLWMLE